jgi:transposase
MARSRKMKAGDVRRARVILRLAKGESYERIMLLEGCGPDFIARWRRRFAAERLAGLYARHRGRVVSDNVISQEARILSATRQATPDGSTHWSTRKLARHLGVSHSRVARVWARAGIQPHRLRRYMVSTDPEFEEKAADRFCPFPLAGPSDTVLSTTATVRCRCTQRCTPLAVRSSARPLLDTPVQSSWLFWKT